MVNILVLVPVCLTLLFNVKNMEEVAGPFTPARGILLAIYMAILLGSIALLFRPRIEYVTALLTLQIVYKVLTPFTVKTIRNPIVISNLIIAAIHSVTIYTLL